MSTTPDGRAWLTSAAIAERIVTALERSGVIAPEDGADARAVAEVAYRSTGYDMEFKILRLTEQLRSQIDAGAYASVAEVQAEFDTIYDAEILAQFDEEGRPIGGEDDDDEGDGEGEA